MSNKQTNNTATLDQALELGLTKEEFIEICEILERIPRKLNKKLLPKNVINFK